VIQPKKNIPNQTRVNAITSSVISAGIHLQKHGQVLPQCV
jgi:hypothetical protein